MFFLKRFGFRPLRNFIGYISNNVFPAPLAEQEEADCLKRFQKGDEDARNILIEHNLRLVAHICKKFENTGLDKDDLISIGTIGLIKGINTFQGDKGTRLATYAARCIENAILSLRHPGSGFAGILRYGHAAKKSCIKTGRDQFPAGCSCLGNCCCMAFMMAIFCSPGQFKPSKYWPIAWACTSAARFESSCF